MSEDSNQSESREDSQPPTPPTKRNNQKSLHKSSENTTPIAQSNGPSRPKRATRSSGVQGNLYTAIINRNLIYGCV